MINLFDPKSNTCPRAVRRCSAQTWLSAVAPCHRPRSARTEVTIAFQLPEARANEWSKHLSCIQYIALLCEFALQTASHLYRKQFALQTARNLLCKLQSELVRNFELTGATKVGNEGGSPATSTEWIHALFLHEPRESVGYVVLTSSAFRNFPGNQTTTDGRTQLSWQFRRGQGRLWLLVTKNCAGYHDRQDHQHQQVAAHPFPNSAPCAKHPQVSLAPVCRAIGRLRKSNFTTGCLPT